MTFSAILYKTLASIDVLDNTDDADVLVAQLPEEGGIFLHGSSLYFCAPERNEDDDIIAYNFYELKALNKHLLD